MRAVINDILLGGGELGRHILSHVGTCLTDNHRILATRDGDDVAVQQDGVVLHVAFAFLYLVEVDGNVAIEASFGAEEDGMRFGIVEEASCLLDNLPELGLIVIEEVGAGIFHAAVHLNIASGGVVGNHAYHDVVEGLQLEVFGAFLGFDNIVVFIDGEGEEIEIGFFLFVDIETEHFYAIVGGTHFKSTGHHQ